MHNTYDIEFVGPNTMIGSFYLGALRAATRLAEYLGDKELATTYRQVYERGRAAMEDLFNGEYYVQHCPDDVEINGCLSDQLIGQWFAHIVGLGYLLDPEHVRSAMRAVFEHNWRTDFWEHANPQRIYALNDEQGLLLCSWPRGERPRFPFVYSDEVWCGIEYQVASHLIYEGFVDEGLAVVKARGWPSSRACAHATTVGAATRGTSSSVAATMHGRWHLGLYCWLSLACTSTCPIARCALHPSWESIHSGASGRLALAGGPSVRAKRVGPNSQWPGAAKSSPDLAWARFPGLPRGPWCRTRWYRAHANQVRKAARSCSNLRSTCEKARPCVWSSNPSSCACCSSSSRLAYLGPAACYRVYVIKRGDG